MGHGMESGSVSGALPRAREGFSREGMGSSEARELRTESTMTKKRQGGGVLTETGAQRLFEREAWEKRIRSYVAKYPRAIAAEKLGVSLRQLRRYCIELGIPDGREKVAASDTRVSIRSATRDQ
jgi:hypothetical protein